MALFTDSDVVALDDLLQFEATLVQIASSHGINVDTKISLATSVVGDKVMRWLLGVGMSDPQWLNRRRIGLSTVVVTPPLFRWLCFESLSRFFAEAYSVQLNSRFQAKWTEYQQEARNASDMASVSGIGIVYKPLPKPDLPLISVQTGDALAQAMTVQTSWLDVDGNEGALSPVNAVVLKAQSSITVDIAEGVLEAPAAASGWNVYVGSGDDELTNQNSLPLALGSTWTLPVTGLIDGASPANGQIPDTYITISRQIQRG